MSVYPPANDAYRARFMDSSIARAEEQEAGGRRTFANGTRVKVLIRPDRTDYGTVIDSRKYRIGTDHRVMIRVRLDNPEEAYTNPREPWLDAGKMVRAKA